MRTLVTRDTDFSNISWNWLCYQHASVLFTWNIFGSWLYFLMPFYYRYDCIHICRVWYELFEKTNEISHIVQSVALGVCFSIVYLCMYIYKHQLYLLKHRESFNIWPASFRINTQCKSFIMVAPGLATAKRTTLQ